MSEIEIRPASAEEIRSLRHRILRAGLPMEAADFDGDALATTFHAAAVTRDGDVVGCATIMLSEWAGGPAWRLRGMAVEEGHRQAGIGRRLLELCESHCRAMDRLQLWCNARTPAVPFYAALGWLRHGEEFAIPTAGPHYIMSKRLLKQ